jgi:hypothetical protein
MQSVATDREAVLRLYDKPFIPNEGRGSTVRHPHPSPVPSTQAGKGQRPQVELQARQRQLHPPLPPQLQRGTNLIKLFSC